MSPLGPLDPTARSGVLVTPAAVRRTEKPSSSNDLNQDPRDFRRPPRRTPHRLQVELVCQDGIATSDPFWDGPRLRPTFAAQLLGQVMEADHKSSVAPDAYAPRAITSGALFATL